MMTFQTVLFVIFATIAKVAHAFAPRLVAATFQSVSHQGFDLLVTDPVFSLNVGKADVIRQCHLDDFADVFGGEICCFYHTGQLGGCCSKASRFERCGSNICKSKVLQKIWNFLFKFEKPLCRVWPSQRVIGSLMLM